MKLKFWVVLLVKINTKTYINIDLKMFCFQVVANEKLTPIFCTSKQNYSVIQVLFFVLMKFLSISYGIKFLYFF